LSAETLHERALICASHRDVVLAIVSGAADAGVASLAWAERAGLACMPIVEEDYGICMRARDLTNEFGRALVRVLQGAPLKRQLAGIAGYQPREAGALRV
jgi:molybdate-binding protein